MTKPQKSEHSNEQEQAAMRATLPPPGTPLTGGGGVLPNFGPSQVRASTVLSILLTTSLAIAGFLIVRELAQIVRWLLIALFLAVAISPLLNALTARGVRRGLAILLSYLALLGVLVLFGVVIIPPLVNQAQGLTEFVVDQSRRPGGLSQGLQELADQYGAGGYVSALREQVTELPGQLSVAAAPLLAITRSVIGSVTALLSILLLSFFMLKDGDRFITALLALFHPAQQPRLRRLLGEAAEAVHGYVNGNLLISFIAGVAAYLVLTVMGLPYAVALALLIALFDLIPLVGSTLGAVLVVMVAAFIDPGRAGILAIFFLLYQQVENNVLQPLVYGRSVRLHPLVIFVAVLAGGQLLGILGALLAIPTAEIIRILGAEWLASRAQATGGIVHGTDEEVPLDAVVQDATGSRAGESG